MSPKLAAIESEALNHLTAEERVQLAEALWKSVIGEVHADPELLPLSEAERAELDHRLADYEAHPETSVSWEEVRSGILGRK